MKRLLLPLLAALALPTVVNAETWVNVYTASGWCEVMGYGKITESKCQEILGRDYELLTSYVVYVDAQSIVNRGDIRDFKHYVYSCSETLGCRKSEEVSKTFNCSNATYYSQGSWYSMIDEIREYPSALALFNYVCLDYQK